MHGVVHDVLDCAARLCRRRPFLARGTAVRALLSVLSVLSVAIANLSRNEWGPCSTNGDPPEIDLSLSVSDLNVNWVQLDPQGNMWLSLAQGSAGLIWKLDAGQLVASGPVAPVAVLKTVGPYNGWTGGLTFDKTGNLWANEINTSDPGNSPGAVVRFDATTLATLTTTSAMLTPDFSITKRTGPPGIALDEAGNVYTWLAGAGTPLGRYDAAQVTGSGSISGAPALTLPQFVAKTYSAGDLLLVPGGLAAAGYDLFFFSTSQIAQTGTPASPAPQAHVVFPALANAKVAELAIAPDGSLFVGASLNKILKIAATDLAGATGTVMMTPTFNLRAPTSNPNAAFTGMTVH